MFKLAYFSFIATVLATPLHLIAGTVGTRLVPLALLLAAAIFATIGFHRRP